jgi:hypothetical protein
MQDVPRHPLELVGARRARHTTVTGTHDEDRVQGRCAGGCVGSEDASRPTGDFDPGLPAACSGPLAYVRE